MNERPTPEPNDASNEVPEEKPWVRPVLKPLGSMRDRILGVGKTGSNLDQDPTNTFKTGAG